MVWKQNKNYMKLMKTPLVFKAENYQLGSILPIVALLSQSSQKQ